MGGPDRNVIPKPEKPRVVLDPETKTLVPKAEYEARRQAIRDQHLEEDISNFVSNRRD